MTKYDIAQWCDFARGVTDADTENQMRRHLERSPRARRRVELLNHVAELGQRDQEIEVPSHALRVVKAIGSLRRPMAAASSPLDRVLRRLVPTVVFDSMLEPVAAGTRDIQSHERQILFRADDYTVDVRLEQEDDPPSSVVVGQLLRRNGKIAPVPKVPVLVLADGRIVGRSLTSSFGEFQAEGLPLEPLNLCLLVEPEECIEIPLGTDAAM